MASFTRPASAETTTMSSGADVEQVVEVARPASARRSCGRPAPSKKPCSWPACRSMVSTRSTPAAASMSATSLAVIGSRGMLFLSWRPYGYHGMTAVIALGRRQPRRLGHDHELHQRVVGGRRARLHDEHVGAADRLLVADVHLAVRERLQQHVAELDADALGDRLAQRRVGAAAEEHEPLVRRALHPARMARRRSSAAPTCPRPGTAGWPSRD